MHKCKASEKQLLMKRESKHSRSTWTFQQFVKLLPRDVTLLCLTSVTVLPVAAGEQIKRLHSFILVSGSARDPFSPSFFNSCKSVNEHFLQLFSCTYVILIYALNVCQPLDDFLDVTHFTCEKGIKYTRDSLLLLWNSYICLHNLTLCQCFHAPFLLLTPRP